MAFPVSSAPSSQQAGVLHLFLAVRLVFISILLKPVQTSALTEIQPQLRVHRYWLGSLDVTLQERPVPCSPAGRSGAMSICSVTSNARPISSARYQTAS